MGHGAGGNGGIELVRTPLPIYPHARTVTTEEHGLEVAALLGDSRAILLTGHGATAIGDSLEGSVMTMVQLEEQARANFDACCALGPNYPSIPDALIDEFHEVVPAFDLPHFKGAFRPPTRRPGGVWAYYVDMVSQDL